MSPQWNIYPEKPIFRGHLTHDEAVNASLQQPVTWNPDRLSLAQLEAICPLELVPSYFPFAFPELPAGTLQSHQIPVPQGGKPKTASPRRALPEALLRFASKVGRMGRRLRA